MSFRFHRHQSAAHNFHRIAKEELQFAVQNLAAPRASGDAIHNARKSLKKLRALLRMVRPEIGKAQFREFNQTFRDAGQTLSRYRDAEVLVETFDRLRPEWKDVDRALLTGVRRGLVLRHKQMLKQTELVEHRKDLAEKLSTAASQLEQIPALRDGFTAFEEGFEASYRAGRKALARALKRSSVDNLHELRKRLKDHWYHIRLLEDLWKEMIPAYETALKEVETALGDDHNLVLLRAELKTLPHAKPLLRGIARTRKVLREQAFAGARRIYEQRPRALAREMGRLWEIWRADPKGAKKPVLPASAASRADELTSAAQG